MTREEKAHSLGQEYFPSANNIWARPNYEAQWVSEACMKMAEWEHKRLVEKACEWLESALKHDLGYYGAADFADAFRKAMEE